MQVDNFILQLSTQNDEDKRCKRKMVSEKNPITFHSTGKVLNLMGIINKYCLLEEETLAEVHQVSAGLCYM